MDKIMRRIIQVIFGPLIVAILLTACRQIIIEVSGDATVTTNDMLTIGPIRCITNDTIPNSWMTNLNGIRLNPAWDKFRLENPGKINPHWQFLYDVGIVLTNKLRNPNVLLTNDVKLDGYLVSTNAHFHIQAAKEFGVLTNLVNELVTSGEFCRVRGHKWGFSARAASWALSSMTPHEYRECSVCGKIEERSMPAWPTP